MTLIFAHRAIKALREEVRKYHQMNSELEEECKSVINHHSSHTQELEKIKDEIKVTHYLIIIIAKSTILFSYQKQLGKWSIDHT